jgi:hypothetical protein
MVKLFNVLLKTEIQSQVSMRYWNIQGVKNSPEIVYLDDGVHFNDEGNHKYYRNVRGAIIQAIRI